MKDMTVSKALNWLFIAEILAILAFIPLVGGFLLIASFVLNLLALYGASKLESGYHNAFILAIAGIVISLVSALTKNSTIFSTLLSICSTVVSLGIIFFVVNTTGSLLQNAGASDIAATGRTVWTLNLICAAASVVLSLLALLLPVIAAVLAIIVGIIQIVAYVMYLVFLNKSSKAL